MVRALVVITGNMLNLSQNIIWSIDLERLFFFFIQEQKAFLGVALQKYRKFNVLHPTLDI